jgi:hypothetical protein
MLLALLTSSLLLVSGGLIVNYLQLQILHVAVVGLTCVVIHFAEEVFSKKNIVTSTKVFTFTSVVPVLLYVSGIFNRMNEYAVGVICLLPLFFLMNSKRLK